MGREGRRAGDRRHRGRRLRRRARLRQYSAFSAGQDVVEGPLVAVHEETFFEVVRHDRSLRF